MGSKLHFECKFGSSEFSEIGLPVEVRKADLVLVKSGLTTQPMELEPGTYYVTAKLPAGQELYGDVVVEGPDTTVELTPEPGDESPNEWQSEQHFFITPRSAVKETVRAKASPSGVRRGKVTRGGGLKGGAGKGRTLGMRGPRQSPPAEPKVALRLYGGNVLRKEIELLDTSNWQMESANGTAHIQVNGSNGPRFVQLLQPGLPRVNMALPASNTSACTLVISRLPDGSSSLDALLKNPAADMLLRYAQKGFQRQAVAASDAVRAEEALKSKMADPVAAAVGAYALLRFGELERLHDWTENLRNWFIWLPDGAVVRGEQLAREGRHEEALDAFLELPERGIPIFSDGLSYAVTRLRLYVTAKSKLVPDKVKAARHLLEQLQRFTAFTDVQEPLTTFPGQLPNKPGNESVDEDVDDDFIVEFS